MTCRKKSYHNILERVTVVLQNQNSYNKQTTVITSRNNVGQKSYRVFKHSPKRSSLLKTFNHPNYVYHTDKKNIIFTSHFTRATIILQMAFFKTNCIILHIETWQHKDFWTLRNQEEIFTRTDRSDEKSRFYDYCQGCCTKKLILSLI